MMVRPRTHEIDPRTLQDMKQQVVDHYEGQLRQFGPTARGMDWKDETSQMLRFEVLCAIDSLIGKSVCEIGCGAGHLDDYLRRLGGPVEYCGIDLSEQMVAEARRRNPRASFEHRDILADPRPEIYDVVMASGLFHVKLEHREEDWRNFVEQSIVRMFEMCRLGIAFNMMSDQVDFRSPRLFYSNPGEVFEFCQRELSRFVTIRHDYPLYEYTVYVYREPVVG
jgi:2-polyprenyl-3-methyl-5-hydroxy-6-metoxy-1,4-benzoquinol methylase